jgi:hypothetical protein
MRPMLLSPLTKKIFLLSVLLFTGLIASAQSILDQKVSINLPKATIEEALNDLNRNYHLQFSYSSDKIPLNKAISIEAKEEKLSNVLKMIFRNTPVIYMVVGEKIVLIASDKKTSNTRYTISGYVKESGSGELLPGVNIYKPGYYTGTTTNNYGFYSITLPSDTHEVVFSYVGYTPVKKVFNLDHDMVQDIMLSSSVTLRDVVIERRKKNDPDESIAMGTTNVDLNEITQSPRLLGEKDPMKNTLFLPGVNRENEISNGYNIRGGTNDQNLVILDDAPIYNAFHLFGTFSVFNGDALKNLQITKGGFPARYGGRLSSVIEMTTREGNKEAFHGDASIGLITSHLTLEGPLVKNRTSFLVSGRRTHISELADLVFVDGKYFDYHFFDMNMKINHEFNKNNKIYLSAYKGKDKYIDREETGEYKYKTDISWGNETMSLRWNHLYSSKVFSNTTAIYSNYRFDDFQGNPTSSFSFGSGIRDYILKHDVDIYATPRHHLKTGFISTFHHFTPGTSFQADSISNTATGITYEGIESAAYLEDEFRVTPKLGMNAGLRLSHFLYKTNHYWNLEPRLLLSYQVQEGLVLKASYARMSQFIHLLSNSTGIGLPTDLWLPTTSKIKPQTANQVSLGMSKKIGKDISLNIEGYYKKIDHLINFKPGSSFLNILFLNAGPANNNWEAVVTSGQAWAYGSEFQLEKKGERFNTMLSYTLGFAEHQFDLINRGKKYWASYDRRHALSLLTSYKISSRWRVSASWVYSTGNAFTLPKSNYIVYGHEPGDLNYEFGLGGNSTLFFLSEYGGKNIYRASAFHKLDLGATYTHPYKFGTGTLEMGIFNVYNRKNPIFYIITSSEDGNSNKLKKLTLLGIMPSLSYSIKF